jgi:hypothetical protein
MNRRASSHQQPTIRHEGNIKPKSRRKTWWILAAAALGLCCIGSIIGVIAYNYYAPHGNGGPVVLINAPLHGEEVILHQPVQVRAVSRDDAKVTRVEFWADGVLLDTETSNVPGGISPFPLLSEWQPAAAGAHTLIVRAFNSKGVRSHASIIVEAAALADADGDGVPDMDDGCPETAGIEIALGCPDSDGDGIPDITDACPDVAGLPAAEGCPAPGEGDLDGDGFGDEADACPDVPGSPLAEGCPDADSDGVPDEADECPDEAGWEEHAGCPIPGDLDADGVGDAEDACPEEWGLPEHAGCPDGDEDGIPDHEDAAPDEPGPADADGAPDADGDGIPDDEDLAPEAEGEGDPAAPDTDGDGASDDVDPCPDEAGLEEHGYCPPPEADPAGDDGGLFFEIPGFFLGELRLHVPVEFEALEFSVREEYDYGWCYVSLGGGDVQRYDFEPDGETSWDIASLLSGANSVHMMAPIDEPLEVFVDCWAENVYLGPGGGEGVVHSLGDSTHYDGTMLWNGTMLDIGSDGPGGHGFFARYRICSPSCDETAFPPPLATLFRMRGSNAHLIWMWEGDRDRQDGYNIYLNGSRIAQIEAGRNSMSVMDYEPHCGEQLEFTVTAHDGLRESPRSNVVTWTGAPCPRAVEIEFETLDLHSPPRDEAGRREPGPLYGEFWVNTGAETLSMPFDASACRGRGIFERCYGLKLSRGEYDIQRLFDWVWDWKDRCTYAPGCPSRSFSAPRSNVVYMMADPSVDITFGAKLMDSDMNNADDLLFAGQGSRPVPSEGDFTTYWTHINEDRATLVVRVRLLAE